MQIKQFFLDLREWPQYAQKQNNLRLLESEAFKEPLKFTFELDSEDKREMARIKGECEDYYKRLILAEKRLEERLHEIDEKQDMITKSYQQVENLIDKYNKLLEEQKRKEKQINDKGLEDNKKIDDLKKEILGLRKEISLPQPQKVYTNTWEEFVTWTDVYYCYPYKLPHGDYCVLEQYEYEPQNEYIVNENKIKISERYISGEYIPEIQLEASNAIDKPVSKVRLTILFFQI